MKIKSLNIKNFKSIVDITINEPNPFTVFVGPNGSGKSNIFEALEYATFYFRTDSDFKEDIFGEVYNFKLEKSLDPLYSNNVDFRLLDPNINLEFESFSLITDTPIRFGGYKNEKGERDFYPFEKDENYIKFLVNHSKVFVGNSKVEKIPFSNNQKLSTSGINLEKVLRRLLEDEAIREEIFDWLSLFIPEFDRIEVQKSQFSSNEDLFIYQKHYDRPFNKELISDGTYNIIALLTAVYQSDEPQFLCIEEPENGLHPKVVKELVNLFRDACEQHGHYIWVNTHSQTLVSKLEPHEVILVDKVDGETRIKQLKDFNLHGFEMDEAWLSNALGGGIPW